jgi:hypothetical protein
VWRRVLIDALQFFARVDFVDVDRRRGICFDPQQWSGTCARRVRKKL